VGNEENGYPVPDPNKTLMSLMSPDTPMKIPHRGNHGRGS
jgi:hypothetical protein